VALAQLAQTDLQLASRFVAAVESNQPHPREERVAWAKTAAVLVAARFCEPSSELHIAEDWYRRTALCDLLQLGDEEITKDRLYRGLDHLLAHKAALEAHLSHCGELFAIENEVLLYDVTSTYFEGQAEANPQAQRGYSPIQAEKSRPDRNALGSAMLATKAVASAGPTPGIASSRLLVSFDRCQAMIWRSNARI
jgi:hypothetical protein